MECCRSVIYLISDWNAIMQVQWVHTTRLQATFSAYIHVRKRKCAVHAHGHGYILVTTHRTVPVIPFQNSPT
jgi:hypothetical protein